jgi:hypothetical protein
MNLKLATFAVVAYVASSQGALTAVVARYEETSIGVRASYSGSINLDGLQLYSATALPSSSFRPVRADLGRFGIGGSTFFLRYMGIAGPSAIGLEALQYVPTSSTGEFAGVFGISGHIWVPTDYISEAPISGTTAWDSRTLASLGLSTGEYVWTWGSGASRDSFTLLIIPESSSILLVGLGSFSLVFNRKRTK